MVPSDKLDLALQAEYLHVRKTVEDFDGRALTIKAWSVTFGLVAIAGAFASHSWVPFLVAAASSWIFWFLEVMWKLFQMAHYDRLRALEAHFRGETLLEHPFQLSASWLEAWRRDRVRRMPVIAVWLHVALPHVLVLTLGVALFVLAYEGVLPLDGSVSPEVPRRAQVG